MKPVSDEKEPVPSPAPVAQPRTLKSWLQIGLVLAVLVGIIGFAAYITSYTKGSNQKKAEPKGLPAVEPIRFAFLDPPVREVEIYGENSQDYFFANPTSDVVNMRLAARGCTCVHTVEVGTWALREALLYLPSGNAWQSLGVIAAVEPRSWEEMPDFRIKQSEVKIPPADGPFPRGGIVRAHWKVRAFAVQGKETVDLDVVSQVGEGTKFPRKLKVNFIVSRPFSFWPHSLEVGELLPGNKRVFECVVWSSTRDSLDLDVKLAPLEMYSHADGCFVIGPLAEVPAAQLPTLAATMGSPHGATAPRSAYRFTLTILENHNGEQLDLGPFHRTIVVSAGPGVDPLRMPLTGLVRGDIHVVGGDQNDRVPLGSFRSDRGSSKIVSLVGPKQVTLEYARVTSDAIKARLETGEEREGRRTWKLIVEAPPESFAGELQNAAVILKVKTEDSKERFLRIPVTGNAYR